MAFVSTPDVSPELHDESVAAEHEDFGVIDRALRFPLSALLGWSAIWLLIGFGFELIASWQTLHPRFLAGCSWTTFGRIYPAGTNALIYGWGFNAAFAVGFWVLARLSGAKPHPVGMSSVAILFWNLAVLAGVAGILHGDSSGIEWMELPGYVTPILLISFVVLGSGLVITLRHRGFTQIFISQWYIVAGLFWFAWIFSVSQLMLIFFPVRGTVQAVISAWYTQGLFGLWFGSIALGVIYYFLPKLTGRTIRYYSLAVIGFWSFGIFNGWIGVQRLAASPVPAWVQSVGVATCLLSLVPLAIISLNVHGTLLKNLEALKQSAALKFVALGAAIYTISGFQFVLSAIGEKGSWAQMTYEARSQIEFSFFGFFSLSALGAIYYLLPRIAGRAWSSAPLITLHWLGSSLGVILLFVGTLLAGLTQSAELPDSAINLIQIFEHTSTFLTLRLAGFALLLFAQLAFAINVALTLGQSWVCCKSETDSLPAPVATEVTP